VDDALEPPSRCFELLELLSLETETPSLELLDLALEELSFELGTEPSRGFDDEELELGCFELDEPDELSLCFDSVEVEEDDPETFELEEDL